MTRRRTTIVVLGVALLVACLVSWSPFGAWADRAIAPLRFTAADRPASGRVVVVEMDAASVRAIRRWPWPRDHYAAVVDRLRAAGAASITFDVDLSTPATADGDAEFARALARADGLVTLPTFAQGAGSADARSIDALPLPAFRPHVALASVSIAPDDDGIVRRALFGTITDGTPRPSLSAWIARRSGAADESFPIAFGIDPRTIPRLSFVAVRDGKFDPRLVRGREILIGATAIEMGDRYATPLWGVIPGVVVQALAAETLLPGIPRDGSSLPLVAIALVAGVVVLRARRLGPALLVAAATPFALFAVAVLLQTRAQYFVALAPALTLVLTVALARIGLHLAARFDAQRLVDETTGLPNRRAMMRAGEVDGAPIAVVLIANLDPLLSVLGAGAERDLVLRIAERLKIAGGNRTVYRLADRLLAVGQPASVDGDAGGDRAFAARLRSVMLQPVEVAGRRVDPAIHMGFADEAVALDERLVRAAQAAEAAAVAGEFVRAAAVDREVLEREVSLMGELDDALDRGEIEVHYQPKLSLAENRITGVEALVRWRHPKRGMVPPDLFIPLAEQTDRILPLTIHVLEQTVRDLAEWHAKGLAIGAAINVSARLVADAAFGDALRRVLASGGIDPSALTLEVTESATLADPLKAAEALRGYRALGCAVSMDDYGTGQSTLSYLQRLPLSELKIDRSFVQHAHVEPADALMVRSTIDLAHGLGLKVVAEGIEEEACLTFLRDAGCDVAQGYWISRPLPKADLLKLLDPQRQAA